HRPALDREDFLVAPCNEAAVAWIDRWPDWPSPRSRGLALWGPKASGKTHLAHVWREASGAVAVDGASLAAGDPVELAGAARDILVEDFLNTEAPPQIAQTCLFHLYNLIAERDGSLLVTGTVPPARSALSLADLQSRLNTLTVVGIKEPDDTLIAAVLVKQFQDRQLNVGQEVIGYLTVRMERSFAAATTLVEELDKAALAHRRHVTKALAREVLDAGS
ncbi:MAG: DnaA/Hda family protein, partial [Alphaproteobacteria bacterium]|nr:DnaA/Hda family protein [Alphaproteobacteria bacterium]